MENKNEIIEVTVDYLIKKYEINNENEYEALKNGKEYIDSALNIDNEQSKVKIASALIEYLLYKKNGGK